MTKGINSDLVADLTWAELYITKIRENLKILIRAVKNTPTGVELNESAALLRQQLESAHGTAAKLRKTLRR